MNEQKHEDYLPPQKRLTKDGIDYFEPVFLISEGE